MSPLYLAVHPRDGKKRLFFMMSAYLDESGIHDTAHVCVVSGYFGGENQWKKFDRQWKSILGDHKVEEFHSKEFWARDEHNSRMRAYKDWDDSKADQFLSSLIRIITNSTIYPISSAIAVRDFLSFSQGERRFLTGNSFVGKKFKGWGAPEKPYFVPFQHCIFHSAKYCKREIKMDYHFDFNRQLKTHALYLYEVIVKLLEKENHPLRTSLGNIGFPNGLDAPALQAADMLAYQTYQYCKKRLSNPRTPMAPLLKRLLVRSKDPKDFILYDRKTLAYSLQNCPTAIRETF